MINFIKGLLYEIKSNVIIIECNGIGYEVSCPLTDIAKLSSKKGETIFIYTYFVHKEDSMTLYGFISESTKNGFLSLLKVSGIGPKVALKILSNFDVNDLYEFIQNEDIEALKNIPGIGLKTAKQIIFDLKGVIADDGKKTGEKESNIEKDLISALINLGYKEGDIREKLNSLKPLSTDFEKEFKRIIKKISGRYS